MPTKKRTVSVRLDDDAKYRVERAATLLKQSSGAFLGKAGDEQARQVLLNWARDRYLAGKGTFSELAGETGLGVEEIMVAMGRGEELDALDMFLNSCRTAAEASGNPDFLRSAAQAVDVVRGQEFAAEAHRQSLALAHSPHAREDQDFVDAISEFNEATKEER